MSVNADELDFVQIDQALVDLAIGVLEAAKERRLKLITAESCTGGLIALVLTEAPGAADFFQGGFVTYTPEHKCIALGIEPKLIEVHGAVSREVALAMAEGALKCSEADVSVAVTGVAGPERDERGNPVGLVYIATARQGQGSTCLELNFGEIGRAGVRYAATSEALRLLAEAARR